MMSNSPAITSVRTAISDRRSVVSWPHEGVDLRLKGIDRLLVGEGKRFLDDLAQGAIRVRAGRVDPREERLEKRALAGRHLH
jgi:hypothetical protein